MFKRGHVSKQKEKLTYILAKKNEIGVLCLEGEKTWLDATK